MSGTNGRRERVAEGVHRDKYGYDVRVKVRGIQRTKRFSFGDSIDVIKAWQLRTRLELREQVVAGTTLAPITAGSLADEAPRYLAQIAGRGSYKSEKSHMTAWLLRIGEMPVKKITTSTINETYSFWEKQGRKKQTLTHRRRVLRELWKMLYPKAACPVTGARMIGKTKPHPIRVPDATITAVDRVFRTLDEPVEYAHFRVLATTGQRPCQVNRATPDHLVLDDKNPRWTVTSAKGASAHTLFLNGEMVAAWKLFIAADAWGKGDSNQRTRIMRRCGWPKGIRPYNLRHSLAFSLMDRGAGISAVQAVLGHTDPALTMSTYFTHDDNGRRHASELLNGRFA